MIIAQKERKKYFFKRISSSINLTIYQPVLRMRKHFLRIRILPCLFGSHLKKHIVK